MQSLKANLACLASLLQRSSTRTGEKNEISFIQTKENKMIRCNFLRANLACLASLLQRKFNQDW